MNNILRKIGCSAVLLLIAATAVTAKEWRGIVPLKSTRKDVERLFGVPKRSSQTVSYYSLPGEIVVFHFQTRSCDGDRLGLGWNVPPGTIVSIGVIPKGEHRKEKYSIANNLKVQHNGSGFIYYSDDAAGLSIETYKDVVTLIEHYPEASQDNLRCPRTETCCAHPYPRFDEYQKLSFKDEKARLDNFMIVMNEVSGRGTFEILGPSKRERQYYLKLAARAKRYLTKERGLEPERLLLVDGGFNETVITRLSMYSIGGLASHIFLYPQSDP